MKSEFQDRLAVVTGASSGIGLALCAALLQRGARVLAITGSVGKTSTKDMAAAALAPQGRVHAAEASLNNHWGVPLTLARMPADTDFAILELGMNHPGEIAPLARMARPHVAMITTVAPAHMEAFGSLDGIAVEKASILEGLEPAGHAILPEDLGVTPILRDAADRAGTGYPQLSSEYITTARVKGLSERRVIWGHAFRNIAVPLITVIALSFGSLLEGSVLTEIIFSWPGIGSYITKTLLAGDMNAVLGGTIVVGTCFVALNLLSDILYRVLDPRAG